MKIARCSEDGGAPFWAVVDTVAGTVQAIAGPFDDWAPRLTRGEGAAALTLTGPVRPLRGVRLLPPVERHKRVVVAGANYAKHLASDFGIKSHSQPIAFLKAHGAMIGAHDPIRYPPLTAELDHEVELVAVIGALQVDRADPLSSVLGYTVGNDVSARDLQRSGPPGVGMDLFAAKSQDRTTGLGPWIVTRDEFGPASPQLRLTLAVNGDVRQDGNTAEMTWDVAELVRFVDERSSFECGDVMFTGSPAGTGQGSGRFLQPGDVVEATVEGIGTLRNIVGSKGG
ncbi:fumarylacetoacetate hydrolase family protein [Pseudorhodoferax sp. LjRoot39]|uniref:fumarylacetoacetate hydrolase family protein n=1 Tax=Pseudorhodoferax sp. LjRoot39 TaxID=3342328 RepID=UPI003ED00E3C